MARVVNTTDWVTTVPAIGAVTRTYLPRYHRGAVRLSKCNTPRCLFWAERYHVISPARQKPSVTSCGGKIACCDLSLWGGPVLYLARWCTLEDWGLRLAERNGMKKISVARWMSEDCSIG